MNTAENTAAKPENKNTKLAVVRSTVIAAMNNEYGYKPAPMGINLIHFTDDRTNIHFSINGHHYEFKSYINIKPASVWVGDGTIKKLS